jgi:hypothetical protein
MHSSITFPKKPKRLAGRRLAMQPVFDPWLVIIVSLFGQPKSAKPLTAIATVAQQLPN